MTQAGKKDTETGSRHLKPEEYCRNGNNTKKIVEEKKGGKKAGGRNHLRVT
jgi:hypothetical protein